MRWVTARPLRVLTFDTESRPLSYLGRDYTTAEVTGIAWSWGKAVEVRLLGEYDARDMLWAFLDAYVAADMVTGHYIRGHDLPRVNAMLLEMGEQPLPPKMTSDTYSDLKRRDGVSASQESLAAMLGIRAPKVAMGQKAWREANRLQPEGLAKTRRRVEGDVRQHMALRKELIRRGWMRAPRRWTP